MSELITATTAACEYIKKMVEKEQAIGFRLSIKKTGCSGFSYYPSVVKDIRPTDSLVEIEGVKFYIDTEWFSLLQGVNIDYQDDDKTGLKQKRLVFTNPNESSRCGCGESFHINRG